MLRRVSIASAVVLCGVLLTGCGSPPSHEIDQAQGAVDAARAAGADRYATDQYQAAERSLKSAHDAVAQRDYRLALSHALESRDRAQSAAKQAALQQGVQRSAAERKLSELAAALDRAKQRVSAAEAARSPRRSLAVARAAIAEVEDSLQKAGTEIQDGNYIESQNRLAESAKKLQAAVAEIETTAKTRGRRR